MLNPLFYNENKHHNPTELLKEFHQDIIKLPINEIYKKYKDRVSPHEIAGYLTQEVSVTCSKEVIKIRSKGGYRE